MELQNLMSVQFIAAAQADGRGMFLKTEVSSSPFPEASCLIDGIGNESTLSPFKVFVVRTGGGVVTGLALSFSAGGGMYVGAFVVYLVV